MAKRDRLLSMKKPKTKNKLNPIKKLTLRLWVKHSLIGKVEMSYSNISPSWKIFHCRSLLIILPKVFSNAIRTTNSKRPFSDAKQVFRISGTNSLKNSNHRNCWEKQIVSFHNIFFTLLQLFI